MSGYCSGVRSTLLLTAVVAAMFFTYGCLPHKEDPAYTDELKNLRITEINYNPADCGTSVGDSLEFVELKNVGSTTLELGGVEFVYGISYLFPVDVTLGSGEFYILASNRKSFEKCYGFVADAEYTGTLRNSSDTIKAIHVNSGKEILFQFYADTGAWPKDADGDGYTLVVADPVGSAVGADAWRRSTEIKGSPGADDKLKPVDDALFDLRITEINYHPLYMLDTIGEDSLEFIELKNSGLKTIRFTDVEFVSGIDYKFAANADLAPGAFLVLASNAVWFRDHYGFDPSGVYGGQLKNSGETISLRDVKAGVTIFSVTYSDGNPWPAKADGDGWTLVTLNENPNRDVQNIPAAWRPSFLLDGSPGKNDPGVVLVNEVLPHTDLPQVDAIELYNPGASGVDIGGWFLTDNSKNPAQYRIADGTKIPAGGYKVFTSNDFHKDNLASGAFSLSELGDEAYIMADSTGCRGYCHGCSFGAMENGVAYGRYIVPSTGNEVFVPMKEVSLGENNSTPLVGPFVVSEIMYQPVSGKTEYVEITNIGKVELQLFDPAYPDNTWRLQVDGQKFTFPKNISIKAKESFLIAFTAGSIDAFRNSYGISVGTLVFPYSGTLPDSSAKVELEKPLTPEKDTTGAILVVPYMVCEKISYKNLQPWPARANGSDSSITRIDLSQFGNDPSNWKAASPDPGSTK